MRAGIVLAVLVFVVAIGGALFLAGGMLPARPSTPSIPTQEVGTAEGIETDRPEAEPVTPEKPDELDAEVRPSVGDIIQPEPEEDSPPEPDQCGPTEDTALPRTDTTDTGDQEVLPRSEPETIVENLRIPWEIAFLPDGDILVTERPGMLRRLGAMEKAHEIEGVLHIGEGGLLGMALHPDFDQNRWLYLYFTTEKNGDVENTVVRYGYSDEGALTDRTPIIEGIPGARTHNGGRIAFGPDGRLYITTGDAQAPRLSQDRDSLAGKILRVEDDGSIPADNPFGNEVYSYGHRNPQGLAWDDQERLWSVEHGPVAYDELNLIIAGGNYGWPDIIGDQTDPGIEAPIVHSGPNATWAPSGLAYLDGRLVFAGLRGSALYEAEILPEGTVSAPVGHFRGVFGRLRAVVLGPDGYLYVSTSNTDGRGAPISADDRIIRIHPYLGNND